MEAPHVRVFPLLVLVLTLATFAGVWDHEWLGYDDDDYVTENAWVQDGLTADGISWAFTSSHAANWHPLTWMSHMLDVELFGEGARGPHVVNVLLHGLAAALLTLFLVRATWAPWAALFCGALFALHPMRVESVAWVAERKDVLSGFFWMATLVAYERYARRPGAGRYLLVTALLVLGLLSKPMVVTLPCVLLLMDAWPLPRWRASEALSAKRLVMEKLPWFLLVAGSAYVTYRVQRSGGAVTGFESLPMAVRADNALCALVAYLQGFFWPLERAAFYPHPAIVGDGFPAARVILAGGIVVAISVLVVVFRRLRSTWVGWLWFLGTLVPVLGLVQVGAQAHADRYAYIPVVGLQLASVYGLRALFLRLKIPALVTRILAALVLGACALLTWQQVPMWRDDETLWRTTLERTAKNYFAHHNLGVELNDQGRHDEAARQFRSAIGIVPSNVPSMRALGFALARAGKFGEAEGILRRAVALDPEDVDGRVYLGQTLVRLGRAEEALGHYEHALGLAPESVEALNNLGNALLSLDSPDEALVPLQRAAGLAPELPPVRINLARCLTALGRDREAAAAFEEAVRLGGESPLVVALWADMLATSADDDLRAPGRARVLAESAVAATRRQMPQALAALAAAQAAADRFEEASATQEEALILIRRSLPREEPAYAERLDAYRAHLPWRR